MYLVQVVRGFCRWSGTDIPGKRSFDSLDVSHAPGGLLYTDYFKCPVVNVRKRISGMTQASGLIHSVA